MSWLKHPALKLLLPTIVIGYLSAYALNPTLGTMAYRIKHGQIPADSAERYEVFLAVEDCDLIGREAVLSVGGDEYFGIVYDCAGVKDGGASWMRKNAIAAEVDRMFWLRHPEYVGTGVVAEVRILPAAKGVSDEQD